MTSKRRSLINLLSLSYLSKSISKSLLIKIIILMQFSTRQNFPLGAEFLFVFSN